MFGSINRPTLIMCLQPLSVLLTNPNYAFPVCLNKSLGCYSLHIYTIIRFKFSQEAADNAHSNTLANGTLHLIG